MRFDDLTKKSRGPVVPALYDWHRGLYNVHSCPKGNADELTGSERDTVDAILDAYGDKPSQWLSDLTHTEELVLNLP